MKIQLAYPKIPDSTGFLPKKCVAFEKMDGSNIHFLYENHKFTAFGTRRDRYNYDIDLGIGIDEFSQAHPGLEEVPNIFLQSLEEGLSIALDRFNFDSATVFAEFFGPNSFAGQHNVSDNFSLIVFDVAVRDKILPPEQFLKLVELAAVPTPKIVYTGKFNGQFVEDVRKGRYKVTEGVVCKGVVDGKVHMCKIKTEAYMKRLKEAFKDKWEDYWE